ncbi:bifunctional diaminohydroxyphosphoribosylaminopyrimidine deaminase/5-amino-6-(5-phosphoribosylamino)uracil reductase RibD [Tsuneonella aeria]|uniref:bifunctional diaminohydroxyphosphoribosylaminopyrimidine deaminase/5-amino-6-(5-phosphoribosylamino)uracil reductase RibD n=1 Tax=Tsuneonella aeria TaxID=1837929 RepID=UPI00301E45D3
MTTGSGDARWLAAAARLAGRARPLSSPNPAVGCIVVREGRVVGRGWTAAGGRPHAEAAALAMAGDAARGATVYVTLEPCAHRSHRGPACADILAEAAPARVIVGVADPDPRTASAGLDRLRAAGIEVVLADCATCADSLRGYLVRANTGRPHVTLKFAASLDGCIALPDGTSRWITGPEARAHVHARRARADAILVGGGTWRADAPGLDVRLPGLGDRSPERYVLTRGAAPAGTRAIAEPPAISAMEGVQYIYIEGGAETAAAFLAADLVDRIEIYRAPIIVGDGLRAVGALGLNDLVNAHGRWQQVEDAQLGSDHFAAYRRTREGAV